MPLTDWYEKGFNCVKGHLPHNLEFLLYPTALIHKNILSKFYFNGIVFKKCIIYFILFYCSSFVFFNCAQSNQACLVLILNSSNDLFWCISIERWRSNCSEQVQPVTLALYHGKWSSVPKWQAGTGGWTLIKQHWNLSTPQHVLN